MKFGELSHLTLLPTTDGSVVQSTNLAERLFKPLDGSMRPGRRAPAENGLVDSFRPFNLATDENGQPHFIDPHSSVPNIAGSDKEPDVVTRIDLVAFHAGNTISEEIGPDARATLRLDVGQDEMADSGLRPLFWSIAAGLDLASEYKGKDAPKKYRSDFDQAFGRRPIEIGGGLAELRFEVFAHKEQPWWRRIFGALGSSRAASFINTLGFPGIVNEAIDVVNEAFDKFDKNTKPVFRSAKMTFALSARAKEHYSLGMPGILTGVLPQGFTLMIPQRHYELIRRTSPYFLGAIGRLVPGDKSIEDFNSAGYVDPYADVPYALLKIQSKAANLQQPF